MAPGMNQAQRDGSIAEKSKAAAQKRLEAVELPAATAMAAYGESCRRSGHVLLSLDDPAPPPDALSYARSFPGGSLLAGAPRSDQNEKSPGMGRSSFMQRSKTATYWGPPTASQEELPSRRNSKRIRGSGSVPNIWPLWISVLFRYARAGAVCCCVRDFATAGAATRAARATADSRNFRFLFMINLVR